MIGYLNFYLNSIGYLRNFYYEYSASCLWVEKQVDAGLTNIVLTKDMVGKDGIYTPLEPEDVFLNLTFWALTTDDKNFYYNKAVAKYFGADTLVNLTGIRDEYYK